MAEEKDILGASFTVDANGVKKGADEILSSLDKIRNSLERSGSAIEAVSERINKGLSGSGASVNAVAAAMEKTKRATSSTNAALAEQQQKIKETGQAIQGVDTSRMEAPAKSVKAQIREITQQLVAMEAAGQRGSQAYETLRARGAALTDAMGDARQQLSLLSHDNATWQGLISGIQGVSGAFTAATGAAALFGAENEDLQKAMLKVQAAMSLSMGVQQVLNTLNKDSAFRLGIISKLEDAWALAKEQAAAATTAQVASEQLANTEKEKEVAVNAAAATSQTALNTSVEAGTVANTAHAFSWKAVGIAIKNVPVFGWIATALTAVGTAIAFFVAHTKNAITQTKLLSKASADSAADIAKEQTQLDIYYRKATDTNQAMSERTKAVKLLKSEYPDYFKSLKDETILVGDAAAAYRQLTKDIRESAITKGLQTQLEDSATNVAKWYGSNIDEAQWIARNRNRVLQLKKQGVKGVAPVISNGAAMSAATNAYQAASIVNSQDTSGRTAEEALVYEYDQRYKAYQTAYKRENKKELSKMNMLSNMLNARALAKDVHADNTETPTPTTPTPTSTQALTQADAEAEARKTQRAIEDAIAKEVEIEINARKDGLAKTLAQIQFAHDRKIDAIERALEDEQIRLQGVDEKSTGKHKDLNEYFTQAAANTGYNTAIAEAQQEQQNAIEKAQQDQLNKLREFISEYGTEQEKRVVMEEDYARRIKEAQEAGNYADVLTLTAERNRKRTQSRKAELEDSIDWQSVFGDLSILTRNQLQKAKDYLKDQLSNGTLTVEQYKTAAEQVDHINEQIVDNEQSVTKALGLQTEHMRKQRKLQMEIADAEEAQAAAQKQQQEAASKVLTYRTQLKQLTAKAGLNVDANNTQAVAAAIAQSTAIDEAVKNKILDTISSLTQANIEEMEARNRYTTASSRRSSLNNSLAYENRWQNTLGSIGAQLSSIGANGQSLLANNNSKTAAVLNNVYSALSSAGAAMTNVQSGDYTSAAANAASSMISIAQAAAAASDNTEVYERKMNALTAAMNILSENLQTLVSKVSKASTTLVQAIGYTDKAVSMLDTSLEVAKESANTALSAGSTWKKHSVGYQLYAGKDTEYAWKDYYSDIADTIGVDYKSISSDHRLNWLTELSAEQLTSLKENFYFLWAELPDAVQEALEQIINYEDNANSLLDALKEKATGFSFESLTTEFANSLMDMSLDVDDFIEDVNKKFMQAQLSNYVTSTMGDQLQAWYDDFAATMQAGGLTTADVTRLRNTYQQLAAQALDARDSIAEITGYDLTSSTSATSNNTFSGMSSVQADELNGRFTALQIATEAIRAQIETSSLVQAQYGTDTAAIRAQNAELADSAKQTLEIQQTSAEHLARIADYTSNLPQMLAQLVKIESNTKNL